ncbi:MAG: hypothetical protein LBV42_05640 [Methanobrevibacter sp.]|jgi:hypothetical protein|nr:hypothetical protein [Methanobrevibacter sp.]
MNAGLKLIGIVLLIALGINIIYSIGAYIEEESYINDLHSYGVNINHSQAAEYIKQYKLEKEFKEYMKKGG